MSNNPILYLTAKLWKYSAGNRGKVLLFVLMFIIANSINFLEPLAVAKLLDIIQVSGVTKANMSELLFYLGAIFMTSMGFWVFHGPARLIETKNSFLVRANYKKYLLEGVMAFPMEWHADHHSGDTIDKIEKGTTALFRFSNFTFQIIEFVIRLISSYLALSYFNLHASYIVLFMLVFTVWMITRFDKILVGQFRTIYSAENRISSKIFDVISNITTVIILRIEKLVTSSIYKKVMEPFGVFIKNTQVNEVKWFLVSVCYNLMMVSVLGSYFYVSLKTHSLVMIGTVSALYSYVGRIGDLFFRFADFYNETIQQKAAVMNAEEIANEFSGIGKIKSVKLDARWKELRVENLDFSYHTDEGADLHLDNLSLTIKRGQRVALIGESGSGKTTFLKIIRDLYHPSQASIYLDQKELKNGFRSISSDIALIPQDPEIFSTTIKENITVGVGHTPKTIKKFTDMACFTDVVEGLPHKLESSIFEKGVNLSGGQKQRLALARGLMACDGKSIVLLDEPTSSVDSKNELQIFRNIFKSFKGKTILASVHRLHLLPLFDQIHFFKEGQILASGTLKELLANCAEFRELWEKYLAIGDIG